MSLSTQVIASIFELLIYHSLSNIKKNKMKSTITLAFAFIMITTATMSSCKKSTTDTGGGSSSGNVFWHGYISGSGGVAGPGNAVLLRTDGTMREYANDYYSSGTTMGASDTGTAKTKIDGTYSISGSGVVVASWVQTSGSPVLTYTLNTTISGNTMTGTIKSVGTGISSTANITLSNTP
jgi:hypothetical protein